jgi:CRISPR-associated endoribonuclease Cas6
LRILLKLVPRKSHAYVNDYHYHLQAAIYSLIREGGLPRVHDKRGYKFFCFSNIFPFGDFEQGAERNLLVSSPDRTIIDSIEHAALSKMKSRQPLAMGGLQFAISDVSRPFRISLDGPETTVRSATPIVVRIPRIRYEEYGIKPEVDYDYVFWRETIALEAFVKQLRDGMVKKWKEYFVITFDAGSRYAEEELLPDITYYKFIKTLSKPLIVKREVQIIIGSLWEISFASTTDVQRGLLEFAVDCGLGERNSLGFGFVNPQHLSSS